MEDGGKGERTAGAPGLGRQPAAPVGHGTGRSLSELRSALDEVDGALVALLAERCELARQVGDWKAGWGVPVTDPTQEARVVRRAAERARALSLDEEGVRHLFWEIMGMARRAQLRGER